MSVTRVKKVHKMLPTPNLPNPTRSIHKALLLARDRTSLLVGDQFTTLGVTKNKS